MIILALDLSSTASGYAILNEDKIVTYGVIKPDSELNESAKYYYITQYITTLIKLYRPVDCAIEDTFFSRNALVLKKLSRLAGQVMFVWFSFTGREPSFYSPLSCRKDFPNLVARAEKPEIVDAVNKHFQLRGKLTDNNSADALVTGYHHWLQIKGKIGQ